MEHKVCKDCQWNQYPLCLGTKMDDGLFMNIENLREGFRCGQKDDSNIIDFSIKFRAESEIKMEELEARIIELEK